MVCLLSLLLLINCVVLIFPIQCWRTTSRGCSRCWWGCSIWWRWPWPSFSWWVTWSASDRWICRITWPGVMKEQAVLDVGKETDNMGLLVMIQPTCPVTEYNSPPVHQGWTLLAFSSHTIPIQYQGSSIAIQYQCNTNAILYIFTTRCSEVCNQISLSHLFCIIVLL